MNRRTFLLAAALLLSVAVATAQTNTVKAQPATADNAKVKVSADTIKAARKIEATAERNVADKAEKKSVKISTAEPFKPEAVETKELQKAEKATKE